MTFQLRPVEPPHIHDSPDYPTIGAATYEARLRKLSARMADRGLDAVMVYGDREHLGNLTYLTGYDPRFEEALLLLWRDGRHTLLVGNEGGTYAKVSPLALDLTLCQCFSLLDQARGETPRLDLLFKDLGLAHGQHVGMIGWKYFAAGEVETPAAAIELPSFIVDAVRLIVGADRVTNATAILMDPAVGLRTQLEAEQIVLFEAACQRASAGVANALRNLRPGMTEAEIAQAFAYDGRPLNYHPIVASGERTALGLASPSSRAVAHGDPMFLAMGGWGANSVRAGYMVADPGELDGVAPQYLDAVVAPFMDLMAAWYEGVGVGRAAGDVYRRVQSAKGGDIASLALNPGHHIHYEEWLSSPFFDASDIELRSGMMMQMDIIPVVKDAGFGTNAEDGVVLADRDLRDALAVTDPTFVERVARRRDFMRDAIGIDLDDSVLPLSDIQGHLSPLLLAPHLAMTRA